VYGNIFVDCTAGNGIVSGTSVGHLAGVLVYNNSFIRCSSGGWFSGGSGSPSGNVAYNNLVFDMAAGIGSGIDFNDYNVYFQAVDAPAEAHGQEAHGQVSAADPFVNQAEGDFHLQGHTDPGLDLGTPYDVDPDGNTRSTWDRGAYEFADCRVEDGDGYGDPASAPCTFSGRDCRDDEPLVNPGATEVCDDGIDNDCDKLVDGADTGECPVVDGDEPAMDGNEPAGEGNEPVGEGDETGGNSTMGEGGCNCSIGAGDGAGAGGWLVMVVALGILTAAILSRKTAR
jgi:hypothetical protein